MDKLKSLQVNLTHVNHAIKCSFLDKDGVLWFGSHYGVYSYDPSSGGTDKKPFTYYSELGGLCNNKVFSIMEDNQGNLWFGTDGGICKFDRKEFTHVAIPRTDTSSIWLDKVYPIVNPNQVRCMLQDKSGLFWIGTNGGGAYSYDPTLEGTGGENFTSYLADKGRKQIDSLHHNVISSVLEDDAGNIWFTSMTHGGVSRYNPIVEGTDGDPFTHFKMAEGVSDDMVTSRLKDKSGNLWFGSLGNRNGTLDRFEPALEGTGENTFTSFHKKDGICNSNTWCMYEDKNGKLWLGSARGNLCTYDFDENSFTEFVTKDGQTFSNIIFIVEDAAGDFWFGSGKGNLWKYDGELLIDLAKIN